MLPILPVLCVKLIIEVVVEDVLPYIQVYLDTALSKFMVHVTFILLPTNDTMTRVT